MLPLCENFIGNPDCINVITRSAKHWNISVMFHLHYFLGLTWLLAKYLGNVRNVIKGLPRLKYKAVAAQTVQPHAVYNSSNWLPRAPPKLANLLVKWRLPNITVDWISSNWWHILHWRPLFNKVQRLVFKHSPEGDPSCWFCHLFQNAGNLMKKHNQ